LNAILTNLLLAKDLKWVKIIKNKALYSNFYPTNNTVKLYCSCHVSQCSFLYLSTEITLIENLFPSHVLQET